MPNSVDIIEDKAVYKSEKASALILFAEFQNKQVQTFGVF